MKPLGTNQSVSKIRNQRLIKRIIFTAGSISRADVAEKSGLTEASVSIITSKLIEDGILEEFPEPEEDGIKRRGRKRKLLRINKNYAYFIGIDIGPYKTAFCLMNLFGEILKTEHYVKDALTYEAIREMAVEKGKDFYTTLSEEQKERVLAAGLSVPARINKAGDQIIDDRYEVPELSLAEEAKEALGFPVSLINNVKARAIDHALYHQAAHQDFLYFYAGYGLACQYVLHDSQNRLLLPGDGEIGHSIVGDLDFHCPYCHKEGCLESYVAEPLLKKRMAALPEMKEQGIPAFKDLVEKLDKEQLPEAVEHIFRESMEKTALLIRAFHDFISPDNIYFSGTIFESLRCRQWLSDALENLAFRRDDIGGKIEFLESGPEDGARGAASTALLHHYLHQF